MSEMPRNLLTEWSRLIAASLVAAGVRDVVVSPGSRSTPFVLALREQPKLRLTSVLDERVAAFIALGMGRATGKPAAVIATSGTAPAHWLPAVIEASIAHVPLVVLSANRPLSLAHAGAAQTIDQTKLFGEWVRLFVDLGDPQASERAFEGVVRSVGQAVAIASGPSAGPVHLDLHADKPLEPVEASTDEEHALARMARNVATRGVPQVSFGSSCADEQFARELADALTRSKRPLVVAGPRASSADVAAIHDACARLDVTLAAEATSQLRFGSRSRTAVDASEVIFSCDRFARENAPDLVVQIGSLPTAPTLERSWNRAPRFVFDAGGVHDPIGGAVAISLATAGATLARVADLAPQSERDGAWVESLRKADSLAWSEVERAIATGRGEGAAVRAGLTAAPNATLVIGNSLPIRTLDRFVPGGGNARRVLCQRGANGIDGLVSGAIGAALAASSPTLAIVGDVSFVHDMNALTAASQLDVPLVVLVVDNGGGRIFESLPIAHVPSMQSAMPLFTTPHGIDLAAASRAYGVACVETHDASETSRAVSAAIARAGMTVVRAIVEPHDAHDRFAALLAAFETRFYGVAS